MTLSGTDCCEVELLMTGKWSHQLLTVLTPFFTLFNVNFESSYWQFGIVKWVESETVIWLQGWHKALLQPCNSSKERWVALYWITIAWLDLLILEVIFCYFAIGILGKPLDQLQDWHDSVGLMMGWILPVLCLCPGLIRSPISSVNGLVFLDKS